MNYLFLLIMPFDSDFFVGSLTFAGIAILLCLLSLIGFFLKSKWKRVIYFVTVSFLLAYVLTIFSGLFIDRKMVSKVGPYKGQTVQASGFPLIVMSEDSGMTDPNVHETNIILNFAIYFVLIYGGIYLANRKRHH